MLELRSTFFNWTLQGLSCSGIARAGCIGLLVEGALLPVDRRDSMISHLLDLLFRSCADTFVMEGISLEVVVSHLLDLLPRSCADTYQAESRRLARNLEDSVVVMVAQTT